MAFIFLDRKTVGIGTIVLAISFILGIIIGYFGKDTSNVHQMTPRMAKALSDFESSTNGAEISWFLYHSDFTWNQFWGF